MSTKTKIGISETFPSPEKDQEFQKATLTGSRMEFGIKRRQLILTNLDHMNMWRMTQLEGARAGATWG